MLMSISFPAIIAEWVTLDSLAFSSKNDALSDPSVESIAKPVVGVKRILKKPARFCQVKCVGNTGSCLIGNPLLDAMRPRLPGNWRGLPPWFEVDPLE